MAIDYPVQWQKNARRDRSTVLIENRLLGSNIIIYASQEGYENVRSFIRKHHPAVSVISKVEVLGYHLLNENEQELLEQLFSIQHP